jgi:hypothetical protein
MFRTEAAKNETPTPNRVRAIFLPAFGNSQTKTKVGPAKMLRGGYPSILHRVQLPTGPLCLPDKPYHDSDCSARLKVRQIWKQTARDY